MNQRPVSQGKAYPNGSYAGRGGVPRIEEDEDEFPREEIVDEMRSQDPVRKKVMSASVANMASVSSIRRAQDVKRAAGISPSTIDFGVCDGLGSQRVPMMGPHENNFKRKFGTGLGRGKEKVNFI